MDSTSRRPTQCTRRHREWRAATRGEPTPGCPGTTRPLNAIASPAAEQCTQGGAVGTANPDRDLVRAEVGGQGQARCVFCTKPLGASRPQGTERGGRHVARPPGRPGGTCVLPNPVPGSGPDAWPRGPDPAHDHRLGSRRRQICRSSCPSNDQCPAAHTCRFRTHDHRAHLARTARTTIWQQPRQRCEVGCAPPCPGWAGTRTVTGQNQASATGSPRPWWPPCPPDRPLHILGSGHGSGGMRARRLAGELEPRRRGRPPSASCRDPQRRPAGAARRRRDLLPVSGVNHCEWGYDPLVEKPVDCIRHLHIDVADPDGRTTSPRPWSDDRTVDCSQQVPGRTRTARLRARWRALA